MSSLRLALLRDYHAAISEIIIKYNSTLERYAGDGVTVVFNDPVPVENPAAKPRGDIGNGPYGGIVEASLKADSAERSEAVGNPDAETNVVSPPMPRRRQCPDCVTQFKRHEHGLKRMMLSRGKS
jgi:class 3 adenylate cyclase